MRAGCGAWRRGFAQLPRPTTTNPENAFPDAAQRPGGGPAALSSDLDWESAREEARTRVQQSWAAEKEIGNLPSAPRLGSVCGASILAAGYVSIGIFSPAEAETSPAGHPGREVGTW